MGEPVKGRKRAWVDAYADESELPLLTADGLDDAIIGICRQFTRTFVIYDTEKVLQILMRRDGMSREEAEEFYEFNIVGAWVGEHTPAFLIKP